MAVEFLYWFHPILCLSWVINFDISSGVMLCSNIFEFAAHSKVRVGDNPSGFCSTPHQHCVTKMPGMHWCWLLTHLLLSAALLSQFFFWGAPLFFIKRSKTGQFLLFLWLLLLAYGSTWKLIFQRFLCRTVIQATIRAMPFLVEYSTYWIICSVSNLL